jgi:CheY-like chemotaxis protein
MKKILWIEDDALLGSILGKTLRTQGYDLTHVRSAQDALDALGQLTPDLIIADILMPGEMNGFDLLKVIHNDPRFKGVPRIVLSNLSSTADLAHAKGLGVSKFLVKADSSLEQILTEIKHQLGA